MKKLIALFTPVLFMSYSVSAEDDFATMLTSYQADKVCEAQNIKNRTIKAYRKLENADAESINLKIKQAKQKYSETPIVKKLIYKAYESGFSYVYFDLSCSDGLNSSSGSYVFTND